MRKSQNSMGRTVVIMLVDVNICDKKWKPGLKFGSLKKF